MSTNKRYEGIRLIEEREMKRQRMQMYAAMNVVFAVELLVSLVYAGFGENFG